MAIEQGQCVTPTPAMSIAGLRKSNLLNLDRLRRTAMVAGAFPWPQNLDRLLRQNTAAVGTVYPPGDLMKLWPQLPAFLGADPALKFRAGSELIEEVLARCVGTAPVTKTVQARPRRTDTRPFRSSRERRRIGF